MTMDKKAPNTPTSSSYNSTDTSGDVKETVKKRVSPSVEKKEVPAKAGSSTDTGKTLGNTDANGASKNVPDIQFFGDGDMFKLLSKASSESEGWMKSTKAMVAGSGCVVQVTTQQRNPDGSYSIAEALTYVPGVNIREIRNSQGAITGRVLVGRR